MPALTSRRLQPLLWGALLLLVPLAYNPLSRWQYEPDKTALMLAFTGLLAGCACWQGTLPRRAGFPAAWAAGAYLLVRWLSTATSSAPDWSLWGHPAWRNGLWTTLGGCVLFLLARQHFTTARRRQQAVDTLLGGSGLVAAYGVAQHLGLSPFAPGERIVRVSSTLAHPNLLAAYLAMVLPLTLERLLLGPQRRRWVALLALQALCLLFTYSRAGWLAGLTGLSVWIIAHAWRSGHRQIATLFAAGLVAGLIALTVLSILPPLPSSAPHALQTVTSLFRWQSATAQVRLHGWQASLDAIRQQPWLGSGPATFEIALGRFMPPKLAPFGGAPALGGRTHNVYLETALESGLVGLGAYLVMLGVWLLPLIRSDESAADVRLAILAALAADLVNNVFSFDCAATTVLFWTLGGMGHARPQGDDTSGGVRHRVWGLAAATGGIMLASAVVVPDMLVFQAEKRVETQQWTEAIAWFEDANALAPVPDLFLTLQGQTYAAWASITGDPTLWPRGAAIYADLIARRPAVLSYHASYALYLRRWHAQAPDDDLAQAALAAYTAALEINPRHPDLWLDRGLMHLQAGDLSAALADFEQANTLLPDYRRYYGVMAGYALAQGDYDAAQTWNEQALAAQQEWDDWVWRR